MHPQHDPSSLRSQEHAGLLHYVKGGVQLRWRQQLLQATVKSAEPQKAKIAENADYVRSTHRKFAEESPFHDCARFTKRNADCLSSTPQRP